MAVFNRSDEPQTLRYTWKELGLKDPSMRCGIFGSTRIWDDAASHRSETTSTRFGFSMVSSAASSSRELPVCVIKFPRVTTTFMSRLCSSRFERAARKLGWTRIAGLDEAGRGALFGPVVAAAVILNPKRRIVGLDDSKKLTAERRSELAERIREYAVAWAVAEIDAQRIDAWNIYQASRQAMTRGSPATFCPTGLPA